jgi:uroporphyrinogen-III decarboxylase
LQLRREGIEMGVHICGDATDVIAFLVETGAPFLEIDSKVDRQAIRQGTTGKTTVVGTIDPANLLPFGTAQEIADKVREDIRIFAPNGRYICSPGCTLSDLTPFENVRALVDAVHQFGWYDPTGKPIIH